MNVSLWSEIVSALRSTDAATCVEAASRLNAQASAEDIPRLLLLLEEGEDFFIREAAAWPLAELAGPSVLPQLLNAYQRGFDEGHDNDGFSAALLEIPALFGLEAKQVIASLTESADENVKGHAKWLLEFCE